MHKNGELINLFVCLFIYKFGGDRSAWRGHQNIAPFKSLVVASKNVVVSRLSVLHISTTVFVDSSCVHRVQLYQYYKTGISIAKTQLYINNSSLFRLFDEYFLKDSRYPKSVSFNVAQYITVATMRAQSHPLTNARAPLKCNSLKPCLLCVQRFKISRFDPEQYKET